MALYSDTREVGVRFCSLQVLACQAMHNTHACFIVLNYLSNSCTNWFFFINTLHLIIVEPMVK